MAAGCPCAAVCARGALRVVFVCAGGGAGLAAIELRCVAVCAVVVVVLRAQLARVGLF